MLNSIITLYYASALWRMVLRLAGPSVCLPARQQCTLGGPSQTTQQEGGRLPSVTLMFWRNTHTHTHTHTHAHTHKKGDRMSLRNYRGISVINSCAKMYDSILYSRLKKWFMPFREWAGVKEKGGCMEHIVTPCILCDIDGRKICIISIRHIYDLVPR